MIEYYFISMKYIKERENPSSDWVWLQSDLVECTGYQKKDISVFLRIMKTVVHKCDDLKH